MGVSRTQVVKFIRKGDKGEQGATLRGPQAWSDCAVGYAFQAGKVGEEWKDVVLYNGNFYSCKKSHSKTASNYPGRTTDRNNGYWQLGDKIELVATKILLATYALVENLGVTAIEMKDSSGNIIFQAKDGNVTCNSGTFTNINASGIFQSKNEITWNQILLDAFSGHFVMRGPDAVDDYNRDLPASGAKLIDLFRIEFQTDPDSLSRIASMILFGRSRCIQIDPIYGVVMEDEEKRIAINDLGVTLQDGSQYLEKTWYEILR